MGTQSCICFGVNDAWNYSSELHSTSQYRYSIIHRRHNLSFARLVKNVMPLTTCQWVRPKMLPVCPERSAGVLSEIKTINMAWDCRLIQIINVRSVVNLWQYTLCLKKVPTFKLSLTLWNLNRFSKFLHYWKAYEICYKTMQQYPPHLRHVAALPWKIKNSNFLQIFSRYRRKCKQIAF